MRNKYLIRFFICTITILFFYNPASAQSSTGASGMNGFLYGIIAFLLLAITGTVYFVLLNNKFQKEANIKAGKPDAKTGFAKWWNDLDKKIFTRAAPLEKEQDILLDHNYDGIKELDNALPPWWKWGFYITVVLGVIYLFRFHVWKTGPSPLEEYNSEMMIADAQLENFRRNNSETVDEKTVKMADAKGIAAGKAIFTKTCTPCHGINGEGNAVGPNLTDKYWLHGGAINNVFRTINLGVPDKGMQSWGKSFSSGDIKNLASFVLSMQGSNPPNPKAPQGNEYIPGIKTDSSIVKKDSAAVAVQGK